MIGIMLFQPSVRTSTRITIGWPGLASTQGVRRGGLSSRVDHLGHLQFLAGVRPARGGTERNYRSYSRVSTTVGLIAFSGSQFASDPVIDYWED